MSERVWFPFLVFLWLVLAWTEAILVFQTGNNLAIGLVAWVGGIMTLGLYQRGRNLFRKGIE